MKHTYNKNISKETLNESDAFKLKKMGVPLKSVNLKLKSLDLSLPCCKGHGIGIVTENGGISFVSTKTWKSFAIDRPGLVKIAAEDEQRHDTCLVFGGIMDYLSFLAIQQSRPMFLPLHGKEDVILVLSPSDFFRLAAMTDLYERVYLLLPRSECGSVMSKTMQLRNPRHVANYDVFYAEYKTLFEYFTNLKDK